MTRPPESVVAAKKALRRQALDRRKSLDVPGADRAATAHFLEVLPPTSDRIVSGYVAMRGELDPLPALRACEAAGGLIVLPYTVAKRAPLRFLEAPGGIATGQDAFGIAAPPVTASEHAPDLLIVPLAAFDRRGYRMGYGGGFYDAALTRLRVEKPVIAVGWAYAAQEVAAVPTEPHDQPLDWIVTEREALYINH